jgi:outer membrane porin, OprD family
VLAAVLAALWAMVPGIATAQQPGTPAQTKDDTAAADQAAQDDAPDTAVDRADSERPSSTETGQTPLDESFTRSYDEWVRETRRTAWKDTEFDAQIRSYYFDREKYDGSESEAWALGGSVGLKTGYFRERFALGATGYTSQRLHGPEDKDGTTLLKPGQHGYTVLGELYGELLLNKDMRLSIGRRGFDTPYLNRNDSRMTPNTFEAIALLGVYGAGEGRAEWRAGGGYFDEIKERNSDEFVSMATVAGAPDGVERGVYVGGVNYKKGDFSIGAIDYYSDDIINIFYTEMKFAQQLGDDLRLQFALQYSDQQSTGDNLLRGADFSSEQWGGKAELSVGGALFSAAYTSVGGNTDMLNPWSSYPGYTSVQVENFNRDDEDAWMLRAAYNFPSVKGLSLYGLWVNGSDPQDPGQFAKDEYDLNLQWTLASGPLKGLMMRVRYAHVSQDDPGHSGQDELRLMVYYDPASL